MYKVFFNDIPIILSTDEEMEEPYTSIPLKEADLNTIIKNITKGKLLYVNLYHKKEEKLLKHLLKKLPVVRAGGGLVYNEQDEILFIHRNGRWDLPKGKLEKNERIEDAAIREVEEETGVKNLRITKFLQESYHIFKRAGKYKLKVTHWYEMRTDFTGPLIPEESEGIKKVKWKNPEKAKKALAKSYANIKLLFPEDYLTEKPKYGIS